jgi:hypothetical protein
MDEVILLISADAQKLLCGKAHCFIPWKIFRTGLDGGVRQRGQAKGP